MSPSTAALALGGVMLSLILAALKHSLSMALSWGRVLTWVVQTLCRAGVYEVKVLEGRKRTVRADLNSSTSDRELREISSS
jgi:hypothetical protein